MGRRVVVDVLEKKRIKFGASMLPVLFHLCNYYRLRDGLCIHTRAVPHGAKRTCILFLCLDHRKLFCHNFETNGSLI